MHTGCIQDAQRNLLKVAMLSEEHTTRQTRIPFQCGELVLTHHETS